jgi:hypothetical protein
MRLDRLDRIARSTSIEIQLDPLGGFVRPA